MRVVLPRAMLRMNLAPAYADPKALTDEITERYHELMLAPGARKAMLQRMGQMVLTDPLPRLRTIQAPTLLLWGELDAMIPASNAQDYLKAIAASKLVSLPGTATCHRRKHPIRRLNRCAPSSPTEVGLNSASEAGAPRPCLGWGRVSQRQLGPGRCAPCRCQALQQRASSCATLIATFTSPGGKLA